MMLRWEGHVWRKKLQGLCFYIYTATRQAKLEEGYLRQRQLGNETWGLWSSVVLLKTWSWHAASPGLNAQQLPPLSWLGRDLPCCSQNAIGCVCMLCWSLGTCCCPTLFKAGSQMVCEKSAACNARGLCAVWGHLSLRCKSRAGAQRDSVPNLKPHSEPFPV